MNKVCNKSYGMQVAGRPPVDWNAYFDVHKETSSAIHTGSECTGIVLVNELEKMN